VRTIAIANAKGGTGKTTLAVHLAAGLAREGKRVLLVDLDAQASATTWLLGLDRPAVAGAVDALHAKRILPQHAQEVPTVPGLSLLAASNRLGVDEPVFSRRPLGELGLRNALRTVADRYDFAILDCPPEAGFYVVSAMFAAEAIVAPVLAAFLSLVGLRRLEELVAEVHEADHPVRLLGYVLFAADAREGVTTDTRELLRKEAGDKLFRSEVRVSTAAKALGAHRETAWDAGADDRGREDYAAVLREVLKRLGAGRSA
jgi:chromosome partitioning protein